MTKNYQRFVISLKNLNKLQDRFQSLYQKVELWSKRTLLLKKTIKNKIKMNVGRFAIWVARTSVRATCFEIMLSSKAMLTVLPPTVKRVLQQIKLLQVAWILTPDWITLRGSHAIHGSNVLAADHVCLGLVKSATTCMCRFCRATLFFLQQSFDTIMIKANKLVGLCVKSKEIYQL